ncbi:uncharacterized protein LOC122252045 [Penaeus japonicus]|uniref:uncharacterized protein LOC122252045 n=1 Tax=Penaeus japonicus TaxID=27405 RepID=UPI001C7141DF|nr:uncharacterized protein LOC122252045 [Penaeus japonicus]
MSTPGTPTTQRKRPFSQANQNGETSDGTGGLLGALGEVVGEWLQGWGLLGALRKRSGAPGVARSTPATPPTHSHPSSPSHEHIELRQLSFQCREGDGGSGEGGSRQLTPCEVVRRRHPLNIPRSPRPPRHSYYEGSSPDSYLLTAVLIHSLKHGSGKVCQEPHCNVCITRFGQNLREACGLDLSMISQKGDDSLDASLPTALYSRSISQEGNEVKNWKHDRKNYLDISTDMQELSQVSPLSSPSSSFPYAQISPLPSPQSSTTMCSTLTSGNPTLSLTTCESSAPLLESELSSLDISSLTDVTMSSSMLSNSTLSLQQSEGLLASESNMTSSELSLITASDCGTLVGSFPSETFTSAACSSETISSETYPCDTYPKCRGSGDLMSSSVHSLPSRLTLKDRSSASLLRPVLLSSGSLVLLPRRPSLVSPPSVSSASSQGHFKWEENPCYVRVESGRPGEGHVFHPTTLERPAWCDACAHLVFSHATTCENCSNAFLI